MNILFIHANNDDIGGADYCLFKLVYEFNKDNKNFNPIIVLSKDTDIVNLYRKNNIPVIILPMIRIQRRLNIFYYLYLISRFIPTITGLVKIIKYYKIDMVFSNDLMDIYGGIAAKLSHVNSIQYIRMILYKQSIIKAVLTKLAILFNDRILVVSNAVGRYMFWDKKNELIHLKVEVCHDWIDMKIVGHEDGKQNIREELNLDDKFIITSVSRLEPWKGQRILVNAIPKIVGKNNNVVFLIVGGMVKGRGRESYGNELKEIAKKNNTDQYIYFLGERKDIYKILDETDIFVHSPISPDPFPGVVLEAMAAKRVVIGSNDGGIPEELKEGETGLLFDSGNSDKLAAQINYLLANPEKIVVMGEEGYKRVNTFFVKEKILPQLKGILKNVINGK